MSKTMNGAEETAPTMIIPRGTEITVDERGQLSVRAPGNLVIQHSGHYGNLESVRGSIRVEPNVEVEAVSVRCAETCYVQGSLTAWRVAASCLQLEDGARAHIVLQDTEKLELAKGARLVGNFGSEKELFFLFSRFAPQVQELPFLPAGRTPAGSVASLPAGGAAARMTAEAVIEAGPQHAAGEIEVTGEAIVDGQVASDLDDTGAADSLSFLAAADPDTMQQLPDPLFFAMMALEQELGAGRQNNDNRRLLLEVVKLLRDGDLDTLNSTYRTLFSRIQDGGEMVQRAGELISGFFEQVAQEARARKASAPPAKKPAAKDTHVQSAG